MTKIKNIKPKGSRYLSTFIFLLNKEYIDKMWKSNKKVTETIKILHYY